MDLSPELKTGRPCIVLRKGAERNETQSSIHVNLAEIEKFDRPGISGGSLMSIWKMTGPTVIVGRVLDM
jgi:hypothetical protein